MSTTLILSTDEVISSLLGQLSELSGNTPKFRAVDESLIVAINRLKPDVVLLDARFGVQNMESAMAAARAEGSAAILFGGSYSTAELKSIATRFRILYLPLPTDLRVFRMLIQQATKGKAEGIHPAIMSAIDSIARTRGLVEQIENMCLSNRAVRTSLSINRENCSKNKDQLRIAVMDYAKMLREAGIPRERAITLVENAVIGGASDLSNSSELKQDMDAAAKWCTEEYQIVA